MATTPGRKGSSVVFSRKGAGPKLGRDELRAQADAAVAAFRDKGGVVKQGEAVVATTFACVACGHTGVIGKKAGQRIRCPQCREVVSPA